MAARATSPKAVLAATLGYLGRALPRGFKGSVPDPLRRLVGGVLRWSSPTAPYVRKLWGGFSRSALIDLEAVASNREIASTYRSEALVAMATWYATNGDFERALAAMDRRDALAPANARELRHLMPRLSFLCALGGGEEVRALLDRFPDLEVNDSVDLIRASSWSPPAAGDRADPAKALASINAVYRRYGLAQLGRRDTAAPLSLDNLAGVDVPPEANVRELVSVIVPAYNAADTIETALRSLAEQSWTNLEVLIVDDASTDDTLAEAQRFAASDPRFRVLAQRSNAGSYAGRNAALAQSKGDYITLLDGDDWAHPQRIALHVNDLKRSGEQFSVSTWVRATDDLLFSGASRVS